MEFLQWAPLVVSANTFLQGEGHTTWQTINYRRLHLGNMGKYCRLLYICVRLSESSMVCHVKDQALICSARFQTRCFNRILEVPTHIGANAVYKMQKELAMNLIYYVCLSSACRLPLSNLMKREEKRIRRRGRQLIEESIISLRFHNDIYARICQIHTLLLHVHNGLPGNYGYLQRVLPCLAGYI